MTGDVAGGGGGPLTRASRGAPRPLRLIKTITRDIHREGWHDGDPIHLETRRLRLARFFHFNSELQSDKCVLSLRRFLDPPESLLFEFRK